MTFQRVELRGWKEICSFLGVRQKITAKRILLNLNLLNYDGNKPVLNVTSFQIASAERAKNN